MSKTYTYKNLYLLSVLVYTQFCTFCKVYHHFNFLSLAGFEPMPWQYRLHLRIPEVLNTMHLG